MPKVQKTGKRNPYVLQACDRCKAAKVRCDGSFPCGYCRVRDPKKCRYSTSRHPVHKIFEENSISSNIATLLQQQNDKLDLLLNRRTPRDNDSNDGDPTPRTGTEDLFTSNRPLPLFQNRTHYLFCTNYVDAGMRDHHINDRDRRSACASTGRLAHSSFFLLQGHIIEGALTAALSAETDRLPNFSPNSHTCSSEVSGTERIRLLRKYQRTVGVFYPIVHLQEIVENLESDPKATATNAGAPDSRDTIDSSDGAIIRAMIAIALESEGEDVHQNSPSANSDLRERVNEMVWSCRVDLKGLIFLTLMTLYDLYGSRWRLAWRLTSNLTRIVLELGLNRRLVLDHSFPNPEDHIQATNTIWSIYLIGHHLSYALGLSMALQSLQLDPSFPPPVDAPYMKAMTLYAEIGESASDLLLIEDAETPSKCADWRERFGYLQYRLSLWQQRVERDIMPLENDENRDALRLVKAVLKIRANHLQGVAARSFLCTTHALAPSNIWEDSVDTAGDTVDLLLDLNETGSYRSQQAQCNYFLLSALGMLLLTIASSSSTASGGNVPALNDTQVAILPAVSTKAQQYTGTAIRILNCQAEYSDHARYLFDYAKDLTARLRVLIPPMVEGSIRLQVVESPASLSAPHGEPSELALGQGEIDWCNELDSWDLSGLLTPSINFAQDF